MNSVSTMPPRLPAGLLIACLILAGITGSARAEEGDTVQTLAVSARGLDLGSATGRAQMQRRIETAARRVCGSFDVRSLSDTKDYENCRQAALASASAQLQTLVARAGTAQPLTVAATSDPADR